MKAAKPAEQASDKQEDKQKARGKTYSTKTDRQSDGPRKQKKNRENERLAE